MIYDFDTKTKTIELYGYNFGYIKQKHNPKTMETFKNKKDALNWLNDFFADKRNITLQNFRINDLEDENQDIELIVCNEERTFIKKIKINSIDINIDEIKKMLPKGKYFIDVQINNEDVLLNKNETMFIVE